jgi:hypothetical protein
MSPLLEAEKPRLLLCLVYLRERLRLLGEQKAETARTKSPRGLFRLFGPPKIWMYH